MSYEGSDILFEYFFLNGGPISWSSLEFDFGLNSYSTALNANQTRLAVESGQTANQAVRFPVVASLEACSDLELAIQAISISALDLAVEGSGWSDCGMALELTGPGVIGSCQMFLTVREEDRFTN